MAMETMNMTSVLEYTPSRIMSEAHMPEKASVAPTEMSMPPISRTLIIPSEMVMVVE